MSDEDKGNPIPTRFEADEEEMLIQLKRQTGLSKSEIVRRSVRLLREHIEDNKGDPAVLMKLPARTADNDEKPKPKKKR